MLYAIRFIYKKACEGKPQHYRAIFVESWIYSSGYKKLSASSYINRWISTTVHIAYTEEKRFVVNPKCTSKI